MVISLYKVVDKHIVENKNVLSISGEELMQKRNNLCIGQNISVFIQAKRERMVIPLKDSHYFIHFWHLLVTDKN